MPKKVLGIYYEKNGISIAEAKGMSLVAYSQLPYSEISTDDPKVSEDIKIVAALQKQLRIGKFSTKEAVLSIPSEDLIIRFIDLPRIPKKELLPTISFEIRKYIPFKIEELIFNFSTHYNKESNKLSCVFVGVRKETLEKYSFIISQAGLRLVNIEPSFLSVLRILGIKRKNKLNLANSAVVDLGTAPEESNITFLKDGFPEFSRELKIVLPQEDAEITDDVFALRLTNEMRISVDYFRRRFPGANIDRVIFISVPENKKFSESIAPELGVEVDFISLPEVFNANVKFLDSFSRAFGATLRNSVKSPISIDLMAKRKALSSEVTRINVEIKTIPVRKNGLVIGVILGALIFGGVYFYFKNQCDDLRFKISSIQQERITLKTIDTSVSSGELNSKNDSLRSKLALFRSKISSRKYLTLELGGISQALPAGVWLIGVQSNSGQLVLKGYAYLDNEEQEMRAVNTFLLNLKRDAVFNKDYPNISLGSINRTKLDNFEVAAFQINCG